MSNFLKRSIERKQGFLQQVYCSEQQESSF